jgi:hydroxymethylglutaryl-CoA reductase (NADPH)
MIIYNNRHIQIPVGFAGPLLLDGDQYLVPMATTEGALVGSTNRGLKAIFQSGGAYSSVIKDGMTRAPLIKLPSVKTAVELKNWLEQSDNFYQVAAAFNSTSRFARLHNVCQLTVLSGSLFRSKLRSAVVICT